MKIGIDLGGTKIEIIALGDQGKACWRKRVATPAGDYQRTITTIVDLVNELKSHFDLPADLPVGIGTPGAVSLKNNLGVMKNCNSTVLNGRPFPRDLESALDCPVYIANDANCFALAETRSGITLDLFSTTPKTVFGVILGTGVGGGVVFAGDVLNGPNSIAGEWGHNMMPASALENLSESEKRRQCYCGREDCVETYLSGPGLEKSYSLKYGAELSSKDLIHSMRQGDERAKLVWRAYLSQLATALSQVVNILDPDLIVLGGGMSQIDEIYIDIGQLMRPHVFTDDFNTPVVKAKLGDSAGVFGAAWLVR